MTVIKRVRVYSWTLRPTGSLWSVAWISHWGRKDGACVFWMNKLKHLLQNTELKRKCQRANALVVWGRFVGQLDVRKRPNHAGCRAFLWLSFYLSWSIVQHWKGVESYPTVHWREGKEKPGLDLSLTRITQRQVTLLSAGLSIASDRVRRRDHCYVRAMLTLEQSP